MRGLSWTQITLLVECAQDARFLTEEEWEAKWNRPPEDPDQTKLPL